jgi:nitric-oxide synthase
MSGSQTPVFHRYYHDRVPNFFADDDAAHRALQGGPPAFR